MARSKMSDLDKLKKYSNDPSKGKQFAKVWNNASDSDRNAYRNYLTNKINAATRKSRPSTTPMMRKIRNQMKASKKRSAGGMGA